jgi:hypothetical protein
MALGLRLALVILAALRSPKVKNGTPYDNGKRSAGGAVVLKGPQASGILQ